ncbi:MAG: OsmC family protein [Gammaproteobacteria bacterium]|nr:OsmC family protein [Gammaproteobacteria bacterium]
MSEEIGRFTIQMEQLEGFEYKVKFDWPQSDELLMDESAPLGGQKGPNASRMLAAAVGNCLTASLMFCTGKHEPPDSSAKTTIACVMVRDEKKRMRIGRMEVNITVGGDVEQSKRFERCLSLFEDFCTVTASVTKGIPVQVTVKNEAGDILKQPE